MLFVADSPATPEELAQSIGCPVYEVEDALEKLGGKYHHTSALQLVRIAGGYQLCTKPEYANVVSQFLRPVPHKLSRSLMEVLAVVAYKQPVTIAEIEQIRGVSSEYGLRQLVEKRLVCEVGRRHTPGRPVLYGTTQQFLHTFNLQSLDELPTVGIDEAVLRETVGLNQPPDQPALPETTPPEKSAQTPALPEHDDSEGSEESQEPENHSEPEETTAS